MQINKKKKVILSIIVFLCLICFIYIRNLFSFNANVWNVDIGRRRFMINDLEKNYGLIGKTEQEIKTLLGEPDRTVEHYRKTGITYVYLIDTSLFDQDAYAVIFSNGIVIASGENMY